MRSAMGLSSVSIIGLELVCEERDSALGACERLGLCVDGEVGEEDRGGNK